MINSCAKGRSLQIVNEKLSMKQIKIASGRAGAALRRVIPRARRAARAGASGRRAQCVGARRRRHGQPALRLTLRPQAQQERALEDRR